MANGTSIVIGSSNRPRVKLRRALFYDATDKKGEAAGHRSFMSAEDGWF